jgi:hypothetical protein
VADAFTHLELLSVTLVGLRSSIGIGIEVWDAEPYPSDQLSADNSGSSALLDALTSAAGRWGVIPAGRGKVVWVQLPVYAQAESGLPVRPRIPRAHALRCRPGFRMSLFFSEFETAWNGCSRDNRVGQFSNETSAGALEGTSHPECG